MARLEASRPSWGDRRRGRNNMREADRERERRQRSRVWTPSRPEVIERLDSEGLLPAITFIFSRAACEAAVQQCLFAGLRLNDEEARAKVRDLVEERTASIPAEDLHVLGYYEWLEGLERGIAAHHAGMLPTFKEVVEELFVRGLVKAVFATETLALGINMPARSVVLEKLVKWNGEQHADITPGEYTQLTGRAGRRGIDVEGHAVVLWQRGMNPEHLAGLAGTRTYPLRSSFKPSYNMAVNLVEQFGAAPVAGAAGDVVRAVPGGQVGRRHLAPGAAQRGGSGGLQGLDDLPPRRLRGVRPAAPRAEGPGERAGPAGHRAAARGGGRRAGEAQAR